MRTYFLTGMTKEISDKLGVSSQTVRSVLSGKQKGKYYLRIIACRDSFIEKNNDTINDINSMGKEILLPGKVKKEIAATFKTSTVTLWSALKFKTKSGFANTLRAAALERGGVVYDGSKK